MADETTQEAQTEAASEAASANVAAESDEAVIASEEAAGAPEGSEAEEAQPEEDSAGSSGAADADGDGGADGPDATDDVTTVEAVTDGAATDEAATDDAAGDDAAGDGSDGDDASKGDGKAPSAKSKSKGKKKRRGRPRRQLDEVSGGEKLEGKVVGIAKFGAFVDIGAVTDGLVHITEFPGGRIKKVEDVVSSGDSVEVWVKDVDLDKGRISLTMKSPPDLPLSELKSGTVHEGKVTTITKYGAFVDIGSETEGLVHISEMSSGYVSKPEDVVKPGQSIEVRVKEIDRDRSRISLSMVGLAHDTGGDEGSAEVVDYESQYEPEEPQPTVVELALRRALGQMDDGADSDDGADADVDGPAASDDASGTDDTDSDEEREVDAQPATAGSGGLADIYAQMLEEYRESSDES